jgi:hypothetical protein
MPRKDIGFEDRFRLLVKRAHVGKLTIGATSEMTKEITEDEVRKDVMVFANILFERGMTDDLLGVVDAWVSEWRSGAMFAFRAAGGSLYWKAGYRE